MNLLDMGKSIKLAIMHFRHEKRLINVDSGKFRKSWDWWILTEVLELYANYVFHLICNVGNSNCLIYVNE